VKREVLGRKGHQRVSAWMGSIRPDDVKAITDGAIKQATMNAEVQDIDSKVIDRQILKRSDSTYYNRIYVRKYEPEFVRRYKKPSINQSVNMSQVVSPKNS
jgi:hypothetical protein